MKILYCIPHLYNSGGMERVLTQKVNWLAAHTNHAITVLTTEPTPQGMNDCFFPLDPRVNVVGLSVDFNADYHLPIWRKWCGHMRRIRTYERLLRAYIRTHAIDICISMGGKEIAFLYRLPCRTMVEMHFSKDQRRQLLLANHSGAFWSLIGTIRTRQLVRAVRPLEQLIVLTDADRQDWRRAGCENVTVIPNPCCIHTTIRPMNTQKTKTVLAVGRLHEQKGFDLLLQAWQTIAKDYPDWSLRIVGEGDKRSELETQIQQYGIPRVLLAGATREILSEYEAASIFVLSSRYEGLPLALIEAMGCGLPCIAFDCPQGPQELLTDERGWLVPNGDTTALAGQIAYVIAHPQEATQRAEKAQAYIQTNYSEEVIMRRWEQLIER